MTRSTPITSASASSDQLVDQLLELIVCRLQCGQSVNLDDYIRQFPEHAERLRRLLPTMQALAEFGESAGSAVRTSQHSNDSLASGVLGDFRILREIGRGGMGIVYEAEQISLCRRVAVKVLPFAATLDPRQLQRFKNEAQAAAGFHHPNIVPVFFVGCERGVHFYAMQLVLGRSLAAVISELQNDAIPAASNSTSNSNTLPAAETTVEPRAARLTERRGDSRQRFRTLARIGIQVAEALEYAHSQGVIHRDVKPANLLLDEHGNAWITDFGLAQCQSAGNLTMTGDLVGTLRYMSPEQALGKRAIVDHRSDIYSLGATLYEFGTLRPVFSSSDRQDLLRQIADEEPNSLRRLDKTVPTDLDTIVRKALAKDPESRYATAQELADDLRRYLDDKPILARSPGLVQVTHKWARRHIALVILAASASFLLTIVLGIAAMLLSWEHRKTAAALTTAESHYQKAIKQQRQTEKLAEDVRVRLYAADMKLAHQAWMNADLGQALKLLSRYVSNTGQADIRGFEWHYLWRLCHGERVTLAAHLSEVTFVGFSPDGKRVATASQDGTAKVWDAITGRELFTLSGHKSQVNCIVFSKSGMQLATASDDQSVKIWNTTSGQLEATLSGHVGDVNTVAFSSDDKLLASGGQDGLVRLWNVEPWQLSSSLAGHTARVRAVAFSPDGRTLATAGNDNTARLWDVELQQEIHTLNGHSEPVSSVAFASHGQHLVSASWDGTIRSWNVATAELNTTLSGHTNWVQSIAISPDGNSLLSASRDATVRLWDAKTGQVRRIIRGHTDRVWCAAYSPDAQTVATASADGTAKLWDLNETSGFELPSASQEDFTSAFSRDGDTIASVDADHESVWLADVRGKTTPYFLRSPLGFVIWAMSFGRTSRTLALGTSGKVEIWNLAQKERTFRLSTPDTVVSLAFSADEQFVAAGTNQSNVILWRIGSRQPIVLEGPSGFIYDLAFSPSGRLLASAGTDAFDLWSVPDGDLQARIKGHRERIHCITFSPDERLLATGGQDRTVRIWNVESRSPQAILLGHTDKVTSVAFSSDSRTLVSASADGTVRLWNVATGQELFALESNATERESIARVAFCLDGRALAALTAKRLLLWPTARVVRANEPSRKTVEE